MLYVDADFKDPNREHRIYPDRSGYDDESLIKIENKVISNTDDWGDEDVQKVVSEVEECDIHVDASIAKDFDGVTAINFLRWNYYKPAYCIRLSGKKTSRTENEDGSLTFSVRR